MRQANNTENGANRGGGKVDVALAGLTNPSVQALSVWLFMSETGSHNHVDNKDKAKGDGHILMDLGHNGCVGEDPKKDLGNYERNNSQDVEGAAALHTGEVTY